MDLERVTFASDDHGSLLNKVYEMQCVREREMRQMHQMNEMDQGEQMNHSQSLPTMLSSEDRLFLSTPALKPGHGHMLEQDLTSLTSAMTDMSVCMQEDNMQSSDLLTDPHSQASKRTDPVYRATMQLGEQQQQQVQHQYLQHQHQLQHQLQMQHQQQLQMQLQTQQQQPLQAPPLPLTDHFSMCEVGMGGSMIMTRADLMPLQNCPI
eukprot:GFUD01128835.1.p1 GENE.GFUD01128835.1~~GFUD01128835.1.p1  ORF type:complete len:208 (+),score=59.93 GFUD01128835.1:93-716(+)